MVLSKTWVLFATGLLYAADPSPEPRITSVFPLAGEPGKTVTVSIRGRNLKTARSLWFPGGGARARMADSGAADEVLQAEVTFETGVPAGALPFRVVTAEGVTNALELHVSPHPCAADSMSGEALSRFPLTVSGRIANPGDVNTHRVAVQAGQTLTFSLTSGFRGFDPIIAIAEKSGSWFDPERVNPIATNDEPLFFPGLSTDARLVHRFDRAGEYLLRVSSYSGQGGPDYVYQLTIVPGESKAPILHPHWSDRWDERQFTRAFGTNWMAQLQDRGAHGVAPNSLETFRASTEGTERLTVFTPPGIVEGHIAQPGEVHLIQVKVDKAQDLAIEIETPEATLPRFNPVVRLMEPGGGEIVTNVYTKRNNNGLYMMKMIQAKTSFSLGAPGVYTLQIRDITTDRGGADFHYRVLVRPQIPHMGKLTAPMEHLNLRAGETRTLTVTLDREEEFGDSVALAVENLPAGVTAIPAMEKPVERPPLPNGGKLERYTPKPQTASLLLVVSPDAVLSTEPVRLRLVARAVVKGQMQQAIPVAEIPMMVIARKAP